MARSTPAQNPRGWQSLMVSGDLTDVFSMVFRCSAWRRNEVCHPSLSRAAHRHFLEPDGLFKLFKLGALHWEQEHSAASYESGLGFYCTPQRQDALHLFDERSFV
jgi:hypothetical protein